MVFVPLTLLGIGYSMIAGSLWGSIPYTCEAKMLGTAFGLMSAIQNIGLAISPLLAAKTLKTKREQGIFWEMMYYCALIGISFILNIWLYIDDIRKRNSVLNRVDKVEKTESITCKDADSESSSLKID